MSGPPVPTRGTRLPRPANDNKSRPDALRAEVLIPKEIAITQSEIEVFAILLDDWEGLAANDNEGPKE